MHYNQYLYRFSVKAVPIADIVKNSISATDIIADPIIDTSLICTYAVLLNQVHTWFLKIVSVQMSVYMHVCVHP